MKEQIKSLCDHCDGRPSCTLYAKDEYCAKWVNWFSLQWNKTCSIFRKGKQDGSIDTHDGPAKRVNDCM